MNPFMPLIKCSKHVSVIHGRFTIPHKGHIELMERVFTEGLVKFHANKLVIVVIMGKNTSLDKDKNPTTFEERKIFIDKVLKIPHEIVISPNAFIGEVVNSCREKGYEPVIFTTGPDRYNDYRNKIEKYSKELDLNAVILNIGDDRFGNISATKVRESIKNDDFNSFKTMVNKELWSEWDDLRKIIAR